MIKEKLGLIVYAISRVEIFSELHLLELKNR